MTEFNKEIEQVINLGEAIHRLENNPDFKEVIMDCYINKSMEDCLNNLAIITNDEIRKKYYENLLAISHLKTFLETKKNQANMAVNYSNNI